MVQHRVLEPQNHFGLAELLSLLCAENAGSVPKDSPAAKLYLTHTWSYILPSLQPS